MVVVQGATVVARKEHWSHLSNRYTTFDLCASNDQKPSKSFDASERAMPFDEHLLWYTGICIYRPLLYRREGGNSLQAFSQQS
jgi:hypothetical protein